MESPVDRRRVKKAKAAETAKDEVTDNDIAEDANKDIDEDDKKEVDEDDYS